MALTLCILLVGVLRIIQASCNKLTSTSISTTQIFFKYGAFFECAAAVCSLFYLFIFGFYGLNVATAVCAALSAICYVTDLITALEAMKNAPLVLCNMCAMGGGIILVSILGIFFFHEPMSLTQWLGVAAFFLASYCLSPSEKNAGADVREITGKGWLLLIINFLINGGASFLSKYFAVNVENGNASLYSFLTYLVSTFLFLLLLLIQSLRAKKSDNIKARIPLPKKLYLYGSVLGVTCSAIVALVTTLSRTVPVVIINTVPSAISIIGCLFIGALLYKEQITRKNALGVLIGVLSVVMIV